MSDTFVVSTTTYPRSIDRQNAIHPSFVYAEKNRVDQHDMILGQINEYWLEPVNRYYPPSKFINIDTV